MQRIDKTRSSMAFRMDDRKQRVIIDATAGRASGSSAAEVADAAAMEALGQRLESAGMNVARGARALADERAREGPDRVSGSGRHAHRGVQRAGGREHAVPARPQHFGLSHRPARHGPCGAALRGHRADVRPSTKACSAFA